LSDTFRSGYVALVGAPNAGKSTLVNALVGQKVAIVSPRAQTTRNRILGIVNRPGAQIAVIDTPGVHRPHSALSRLMVDELNHAFEAIDVLTLVVDASKTPGAEDRLALERVKDSGQPVFLVLNKIDVIPKASLLPIIQAFSRRHDFAEIIPISAKKSDGLESLITAWTSRLLENPPIFPGDQFTDQPERFLVSEYIREKALRHTHSEVPQAVAVLVDRFEDSPELARIMATIYVERDGQKAILVGSKGGMIKRIGTEARVELEPMLGKKVFLELFVKVAPGWREKPAMVRQIDWRRSLESLADLQEE
jgi:GTP-binding protein Era